jgi:NADH-quinone oxidoreductase subunit J
MEFVLFGVTAAIALVGAVAMLLSRNAVHSALFLLMNFGAIAVLFLLLQSPFLFTIQLTVYAGAIMVLFLFVVMLLGAEQVEDTPDRIAWQRPLGILLGVGLLGVAVAAALRGTAGGPPPGGEAALTFGDPAALGALLFTRYLLPFEITGIILLIACVGVVVLNQRGRQQIDPKPDLKLPSGD